MRRLVSTFVCLTCIGSCRGATSSVQLQRRSHGHDWQAESSTPLTFQQSSFAQSPNPLGLVERSPGENSLARVTWSNRQVNSKGYFSPSHMLTLLLLALHSETAFIWSGQPGFVRQSNPALGVPHAAVLFEGTSQHWGATYARQCRQKMMMAATGTGPLFWSTIGTAFGKEFNRRGSAEMITPIVTKTGSKKRVKVVTKTGGKKRVKVGELLSRGSYGKVHLARLLPDGPDGIELEVVAKCADAKNPDEALHAEAFFESEAVINADLAGSPGICEYLGEAESDDGRQYLLFERLRPLNGTDGPPDSLIDFLGPESRQIPISPREMLRQVLNTLAHLHRAGYVHQDIKLENLILQTPSSTELAPVIKLIDFGSAVSVEGCNLFGRMLNKCELDKLHVFGSSPLYQPPEKTIDPEHPFAFDVFSAAICFLQVAWAGTFDTEEPLTEFRAQLAAADGDLERWLRTRLQATVLPEAFLEGLARFPGNDMSSFAVVRAMLNPDPAKRPSVDALLAHPFLFNPDVLTEDDEAVSDQSSLRALLEPEECRLPGYDVEERQLAIRVQLSKPLGLVFEEVPLDAGGGVILKNILPIGSGAACGQLAVGDRLISLDETSLRGVTYQQVTDAINSAGGFFGLSPMNFLFERSCSDSEGCEVPEPHASAIQVASINDVDSSNALLEIPLVLDSGSFATIGGRSYMEDTYVVTSFTAATATGPRSFILAAVFDGHRGAAASTHAAATLPTAVSVAIAEGEPSPLAVAWRRIVDSYLDSGAQDGSTATAVLLGDNGIAEILNCGDSRTVVGSTSETVLHATRDHDPGSVEEVQRIRESGGSVDCSVGGTYRVHVKAPSKRTVFSIAVARALGGSEWVGGFITNAADVTILRLPADASALILASDGLWGAFRGGRGSAEAVERVHAARRKGLSAGDAAQELVALARERGSEDNCAVVVLYMG